MMNNKLWTRWVMQTARCWDDISPVIMRTGVNAVDKDHRLMTECALELNNLISEMESDSVSLDLIARQGKLLNKLYSITKIHFNREESIIERFGIEGIKVQQREHAIILGMLQDCIKKFAAGQITVNMELKQSILRWVVHHINEIDNNVFALSNWRGVLAAAVCWNDVSHIINSTGIEYFDNQHKELVEVSLRLNKYISSLDISKMELLDNEGENIFSIMLSCITRHFQDEEAFIRRYHLENLASQHEKHEHFRSLVEGFHDDLVRGNSECIESIRTAILEWWINHINEDDINSYSIEKYGVNIIQKCTAAEEIASFIRKTGVDSVDSEHVSMVYKAVRCIQILGDTSKSITSSESADLINEVVALACMHFKNEENVMREMKLDGIDGHKKEHEQILSSLRDIQKQICSQNVYFSSSIRNRILDWWINHTNFSDYIIFKQNKERC